jgi:hypothetical protein
VRFLCGDARGVSQASFKRWDKGGGGVLPGLLRGGVAACPRCVAKSWGRTGRRRGRALPAHSILVPLGLCKLCPPAAHTEYLRGRRATSYVPQGGHTQYPPQFPCARLRSGGGFLSWRGGAGNFLRIRPSKGGRKAYPPRGAHGAPLPMVRALPEGVPAAPAELTDKPPRGPPPPHPPRQGIHPPLAGHIPVLLFSPPWRYTSCPLGAGDDPGRFHRYGLSPMRVCGESPPRSKRGPPIVSGPSYVRPLARFSSTSHGFPKNTFAVFGRSLPG